MKEELMKRLELLRRDDTEESPKASIAEAIDVLIECCEFILNNQPERSKREDFPKGNKSANGFKSTSLDPSKIIVPL